MFRWSSEEYSQFYLDSETLSYSLHISNGTGDAGDSFNPSAPSGKLNGRMFSSWDRDNDAYANNCAAASGGGWWYRSCSACHLFSPGGVNSTYDWVASVPLQTSRMMIKCP